MRIIPSWHMTAFKTRTPVKYKFHPKQPLNKLQNRRRGAFHKKGGVNKHQIFVSRQERNLSACELRHSLRSFRYSVLCQLSRKNQTHSSLNLARSDCRLLVVPCKPSSFLCKLLEDIVDERVHDAHRLRRDSSVRVHLQTNKPKASDALNPQK